MANPCVFCEILAGREPADFVPLTRHLPGVKAIVPLGPVVPGHVLFLPEVHVADAAEKPFITADVMAAAAAYAQDRGRPFNLITSAGGEATQTVFHLHIHYVPRACGDGLALPWTNR